MVATAPVWNRQSVAGGSSSRHSRPHSRRPLCGSISSGAGPCGGSNRREDQANRPPSSVQRCRQLVTGPAIGSVSR
jgi:hypothetical protein